MKTLTLTLTAACLATSLALSEETNSPAYPKPQESLNSRVVAEAAVTQPVPVYPKAKVSYDDFKKLTAEVEGHRASRLVDLNTFLKMSKEEGVIILDTRSDYRFYRTHIKGAKHLAFTEFTQENLARVIPSFDTKILIYCNNNFDGNQRDFASKTVVLHGTFNSGVSSSAVILPKPLSLALNVPTYINLYGYGYRNVYELDELVHVKDPRVELESSWPKFPTQTLPSQSK